MHMSGMHTKKNMRITFVGLSKGGVFMNCNERMLELVSEWRKAHPNATEEEQKQAFDEIAKQVIDEFMRSI